jgi:dihydrofolate synthase/folylpolyglutamate synthase
VVTQSQSDRALSVADLADTVAEIAGPDRVDARPTSDEAMARALDLAGTEGGVVVTGSITLVAEVVERSA